MKILGQELTEKQLAILATAFGLGILATLGYQKRTEIVASLRKTLEKS